MRAGPPIGAWILGTTAEFTGLKWAFAGATTLYLVLFLALMPKFPALARNMETVPEEDDNKPASATPSNPARGTAGPTA
jgi:hypothetical protein